MSAAATADVVVVGAGMVGAACAWELARAGLAVVVVDRSGVAAGTTGAGEGNILVSDKAPGPELDLALWSAALWRELADLLPAEVELETKGGLVVATDPDGAAHLRVAADGQRDAGVRAQDVTADELPGLEPHLSGDLAGGVLYPQDMQVQPMLAAAHLLARAKDRGARFLPGHEVVAVYRSASGGVDRVLTSRGQISCGAVVNAAGPWGGELSALAGAPVPVLPRRGFVLVTEPLPRTVRHKVYTADYVANVAADSAGLQTSTVVEGTASGPVLIGASRERVGFDRTTSYEVLGRLARQAVRVFPVLASVRVQRAYRGFRPYCPDHLPVIGPDPRVPGLFHACGHEGAGIGLAPATARLVAQALTGTALDQPLDPFSPLRFEAAA